MQLTVSYQKVQQLLRIGQEKFEFILSSIDDKKTYEKALRQANKNYDIKNFKVSNMTPVKARKIYPILVQKYKENLAQEESWLENQRRLFIWLVLCYVFVSQKSLTQMTFEQLLLFSSIFNQKKQDFLKFQIYALLKKTKKSIKWSSQQDELLLKILSQEKFRQQEPQWNEISKQFFQQSAHKHYRSSKKCRQRWMNHLDPNKIKGTWTIQQDLIILKFVKQKGKKWSQIVKDLDGCKTEHMVKNRFNSLVNKKMKQIKSKNQEKIINRLIDEFQSADFKSLEQIFKTSSRQALEWKSNKSEQIKSERCQQMPNIFQQNASNYNGKKCTFFVRRAGSLSMSEKGGILPQLANPILEQMDSEEQRTKQKFLISTPLSERFGEIKSPYLAGQSPYITGNGGNLTPSIFFLQQNVKGNNLYASDLSLSFSSNFDKFVPERQENS